MFSGMEKGELETNGFNVNVTFCITISGERKEEIHGRKW